MAWHKLLWLGVLCVLAVTLLAGCAVAADGQPTGGSEGRQAAEAQQGAETPEPLIVEQRVAPRGEEFEIRLEGNVTTGYAWQVIEIDEQKVSKVSEAYVEDAQGGRQVVGGGGVFVFRFKPVAEGRTKIVLVYRRPWEKGVEPLRTYELELSVR